MSFEHLIYSFDDQPGLLNIRFSDGTPVWLNLRFMLRLEHMKNETTATKQSKVNTDSASVNGRKKLYAAILHSFLYSANRVPGNTDVLTIANYEGNPDIPNRMTHFLKEISDLNVAECLYSPALRRFPKMKNTFSFDFFYYKAWIKSKINGTKNTEQFRVDLDNLFLQLEKHFNGLFTASQLNKLKSQLLFIDRLIVNYRKSLSGWLKEKRPRLVLCSEGNNGDWRHAILFNEAHKQHISTAEIQHGIFNIGMKYGAVLASDPEFAAYKSSYLFTFGKFHCSQTNLPSVCVPLGHYDLENAVKKIDKSHKYFSDSGKLKLLFICEGNPPSSVNNGLISFTEKALAAVKTPFQLIIRLHPSEGPDEKYAGLLNFSDSRYSSFKNESIHGLLAECDIVISHASTVVFEALYFDKPVFILEDENTAQYIPEKIGSRFSNDEELLDLLLRPVTVESGNNEFWQNGGVKNNFKNFFQKHITTSA